MSALEQEHPIRLQQIAVKQIYPYDALSQIENSRKLKIQSILSHKVSSFPFQTEYAHIHKTFSRPLISPGDDFLARVN